MIRHWLFTSAPDGKGILLQVGIGPNGEPHYAPVSRAEALAVVEELAKWLRQSERAAP